MLKTTAFILIALIKTPGEGGIAQIASETLTECQSLGAQIEHSFEAIDTGNGVTPRVLWVCVEKKGH